MLAPGFTDNSFFLNEELIDTVMLEYKIQQSHNGGKNHLRKQAVSRLRMVAYGLAKGWEETATDEQVKKWLKECNQ